METVTSIALNTMVTGLTLLLVFGLASMIDRESDRGVLGVITFWAGVILFWGGLMVVFVGQWLS